jgi:hypothetical protein
MRTAIRGDFERLEQRRGTQELMRVPQPASEETQAEVAEAPAPSWLARLLAAIPPRQV